MSNVRSIQLIVPPTNIGGVGYSGSMVPLGAAKLAEYIESRNPDITTEIIDGSIIPYSEIVEKLSADVVGISALAGNYLAGKEILREAKARGSTTVIGNHHARFLYNECEQNPDFGKHFTEADYIVESQYGEYAFAELIDRLNGNGDFNELSSTGIRNGLEMVVSENRNNGIKMNFPMIDLIKRIPNINLYSKNYRAQFSGWHDDKVNIINTNLITGCAQGIVKPCSYCCLTDHSFSRPSPEKFWEEMQGLEESGFNYVFEACNSFSSLPKSYLKQLAETRPKDTSLGLMIYARANEISSETVNYFKQMNVKRVIFGFDAGDDKVLSSGLGKNAKSRDSLVAANLLNENDIQVFGCFVAGAKGETRESLTKTSELAKELMELKNTATIEYTALAPLPGSRDWEEVRESFYKKHGESDALDIQTLAKHHIETQTNVKWGDIEKEKESLEKIANGKGIVFGGYY